MLQQTPMRRATRMLSALASGQDVTLSDGNLYRLVRQGDPMPAPPHADGDKEYCAGRDALCIVGTRIVTVDGERFESPFLMGAEHLDVNHFLSEAAAMDDETLDILTANTVFKSLSGKTDDTAQTMTGEDDPVNRAIQLFRSLEWGVELTMDRMSLVAIRDQVPLSSADRATIQGGGPDSEDCICMPITRFDGAHQSTDYMVPHQYSLNQFIADAGAMPQEAFDSVVANTAFRKTMIAESHDRGVRRKPSVGRGGPA